MKSNILYIYTRTPLHVGAGSSVGAVDLPIQRERHSDLPIIPGSSLKGVFSDLWNDTLDEKGGRGSGAAAWLFGADDAKASKASAGAVQFCEARLLAFPIRSAQGSFAWITSPLLIQRAVRDGALPQEALPQASVTDETALCPAGSPLLIGGDKGRLVIEEYCFTCAGDSANTAEAFAELLGADPVWQTVRERLVIVSDGILSFFARSACEVAQHVRIDDKTGTAAEGGLFNQENVPSETFFYSVIHTSASRFKSAEFAQKTAEDACTEFKSKVAAAPFIQIGADASTGLGYCTVNFKESK